MRSTTGIGLVCIALACHGDEPEANTLTQPAVAIEKPAREPSPANPDDLEHRSEDPFAAPFELSTISITLERTACGAGSCPNYKVVLEGSGHVRYSGRSCVKQVGDHRGLISESAVRDLLEAFRQSNFFQLRDEYREPIVDHPATLLTLHIGPWRKRIENYWQGTDVAGPFHRAPDRDIHVLLDSLAVAVDQAVGIEQWIGTESERSLLESRSHTPR